MSVVIYTLPGCMRCRIVKGCLHENDIDYIEKDIRADGRDDFVQFYRENHSRIIRGPDGIVFPIISDGEVVQQGLGKGVAYLKYRAKLNGYFGVGILHHEWIDAIHISAGSPDYVDEFIDVLRYLKTKALKLQVDTCGVNSGALKSVIDHKLADVLIMDVLGPLRLYPQIFGRPVKEDDIKQSLRLLPHADNPKLETVIRPVKRDDGTMSYITPDELAEAAQLIEEETGSNKWHYRIRKLHSYDRAHDEARGLPTVTDGDLLRYRSRARKYLVHADVERMQGPQI